MQNLKKLLYLLSNNERTRAFLLLIMVMFMALIDMLGIASILPFIAILTNPEIIDTNTILNTVYQTANNFGIETKQNFLIAMGIFVFLLLIISIGAKALTIYIQIRFVKMCEYNIATRLVKYYLYQPYSWFLNRNSATLGKTILSEVSNVVGKGLTPMTVSYTHLTLPTILLV